MMHRSTHHQPHQQRLRGSAFGSTSCAKTVVLPSLLLFTVAAIFNHHFKLVALPSSHPTSSDQLNSSVPASTALSSLPRSSDLPSSSASASPSRFSSAFSAFEDDGSKAASTVPAMSGWLRSADSRKLLPIANRFKSDQDEGIEQTSVFHSRYNTTPLKQRDEEADNDVFDNLTMLEQTEEGDSATGIGADSTGQLNGQEEQLTRGPEWDSEGYVSASTLGQLAQEASINGTVVILVCSYGYADFLLNWAVYAGELGYGSRFLVFAEDRESFELLKGRFPRQVLRWHVPEIEQARAEELRAAGLVEDSGSGSNSGSSMGRSGGSDGSGSSSSSSREAFSFLTLGFKILMYRRVAYIRTLLNMGFNVLICDSDFIWVKDPLPYLFARPSPSELSRRFMASRLEINKALGIYSMKRGSSISDMELQFQATNGAPPVEYDVVGVREFPDTYNFYSNSTYLMDPRPEKLDHAKLCGGFVLFRNTPGGRLVLELLIMKIYRAPKVTGRENDQLYLGMAIHELLKVNPAPLIGVLPQTLFPPGWLYFPESSSMPPGKRRALPDRDAVVTIHNNWMAGKSKKLSRFISAGLWRIPHVSNT